MALHHILIVDDQHDVRRMLRAGLETLGPGMRVVDVPSGEEGMLLISHSPVDLLVADVRLPGISGLELIQRMRTRNPHLKLILITGLTDRAIQQQVAEAGADAFFYKPIEMADFLDTVERILGMVESIFSPQIAAKQPAAPAVSGPGAAQPAQSTPAFVQPPIAAPKTLAGHLAGLRRDLGARCVLLLASNGGIQERAGGLAAPEDEAPLVQAALAALAPARQISERLGNDSGENLLYFSGARSDLFLSQVSETAVLLLVAPSSVDPAWVRTVRGAMFAVLPEIAAVLSTSGLPAQSTVDVLGPSGPAPLPGLESLFERATGSRYKPEDVDAFWDSLAEQENSESADDGGAISYEQARKLGLAPGA